MEFDRIPPIAKRLSLLFLLSYFGRHTVWKFLPLFFERHIEGVFLVGVVMALPAIVPVVLDIPVGNFVQRAGEKVVIFMGIVISVVSPMLYLTAVPVLLAVGKAIEGVSKALVWNGSWSITMKSADSGTESESISIFQLGTNAAAVVGPALGGYLIATDGFRIPLMLWILTSAVAVPLYYRYVGTERRTDLLASAEALLERQTYRDDWDHIRARWPTMRLPLVMIFLYSIVLSFYWLAVPLLLAEVNAGIGLMGVVFGLSAIPGLFRYVFGRFADRHGKRVVIAGLSLAVTPVLIAMGVVSEPIVVGGLFLLASLFTFGLTPAIHALFDARVPDDIESELTGVLELFKRPCLIT